MGVIVCVCVCVCLYVYVCAGCACIFMCVCGGGGHCEGYTPADLMDDCTLVVFLNFHQHVSPCTAPVVVL